MCTEVGVCASVRLCLQTVLCPCNHMQLHTVEKQPRAFCSHPQLNKNIKKRIQAEPNSINQTATRLTGRAFYCSICYQELQRTSVCCSSRSFFQARVRSVSDPSSCNPTSKDKPHPRASPPAHEHVCTKLTTLNLTGLKLKASFTTRPALRRESSKNTERLLVFDNKEGNTRVGEMILEFVHAGFQRETYGADVYGFVEEGNDRPLAEGSSLRQRDRSCDHFLGADSCCLHLYSR